MTIVNPTRDQQKEILEKDGFALHVHFIKDVPNLVVMMAEFSDENYVKHKIPAIICFCTLADVNVNDILHRVVELTLKGQEIILNKPYLSSDGRSYMITDYQRLNPSSVYYDPIYKSILVVSDENHHFPWEEGYTNKYKSVMDDIFIIKKH